MMRLLKLFAYKLFLLTDFSGYVPYSDSVTILDNTKLVGVFICASW